MEKASLDSLPEFLIGQAQDQHAMTGCTAIIAPQGAVCGIDIRGGSPGTRDTAALNPLCNRKTVHAVLLSGGSSFGLDAAGGLMQLLEEKRIGRDVGVTVVPNICSAILFDLKCGSAKIRPDSLMGRRAGENAFSRCPFQSGNYGAGTGATIGKTNGLENAMKGGIGMSVFLHGDIKVGAIFAVNCVGDIVENGKIIAGARKADQTGFADSEKMILNVTVSPSFEGQSTGSITVNGNYPALAYYPHGSSIANAVKVTGTTITGLAAGDYYVFVPAYSEGNTFYIRSTTTKKLTVGETEAAHYYVGLTSDEHSSWSDGDATLSVIQGAGRTLSLQVSIDNEYRNAYVLDSVTVNPANAVLKTEKVSDTLWNVLVSDITGDVTVAAHSKPIPEYRVTLSQKEGAKWLGNSGNESFSIKPTASKSVYVKPTDTERYYISGVTALPEQNADISFYQNTGEVFVQNVTGNVTLVPLVVEKSIPASITVTDVQFNRNGIYSEENPSIQTTFRVEVRDQFDQPIPGTKLYFKDDQSEVSFTQVRQTDSEGVASFKYSYGIQEGKATADYNAVFSTSSGFAAGEVTVQQAIHLVLQRKADLLLYQNQIIGTTPGENNGKVIDVPDNYEIWTGEVHQGAIVIGSGEWQRALNGEITGLSAGQHILRAGESVNETTHTFYFASDYADFFVPRGLWKVAVDVSASEHVSFPQGTELTAEPGVEVYLYAQPEEGYRINAYSVDKPSRIGALDYDENDGYFIIKGVSGNVILTVTAEPVQEESEEEESDDKEPADEEQVDEEQAEKNTTEYVFLEGSDGAWFKESNTFLRFRVDGEYEKFTGIQINHAPVPDTAYISERGSTIIIIKPEYLETLSLGKYTLTVGFSDGSAQTEFTVNQAKSGGNSPATGEGNGIATALAAMLLSLVAVTFAYRKKIRSLIIN